MEGMEKDRKDGIVERMEETERNGKRQKHGRNRIEKNKSVSPS